MSRQEETYLDKSFATFLANRSGLAATDRDEFYGLVLRLSMSLSEGHSCLEVTLAEQSLLRQLNLVTVIDSEQATGPTPLVLDGTNLYLARYYHYENRLARQIRSLADIRFTAEGNAGLLELLFPGESPESSDQMRAALIALRRALIIVNGGPGTGKTTTVVKMLAIMLASGEKNLRIGMAAPTGKAAMRLSESIGNSLAKLSLPEVVREAMPESAVTLHRLLGVRKNSPQFKHNSARPLEYDVVVIDEASMVDLAMMSKLVDALKPGSRLILLGDKDQLASVESGAVLGDLIHTISDNCVELRKTYRFDDNIKQLATNVNISDHGAVWQQLTGGENGNVSLCEDRELYSYLSLRYGEYLAFVQGIASPEEADVVEVFSFFSKFQVLCGVAFTERGVFAINRLVEQSLALRGFNCKHNEWYPGRPILITRNDYGLDLYNGDIGICLWDSAKNGLRVWFERSDGSLKSCAINMLPTFETVYAMTIHKSQGSEFREVLVVLPTEDNRILSRELIYTAVTRAKKKVRIAADRSVLTLALQRQHSRHSGLRKMLLVLA
ncbi:MAG: exodeoxyribonuclease V alpha subunit [Desulforhopalus sp.]|jgi:exodeoxyribonuclease V alpha subunit